MNKEVPIWERYALTIREASAYFRIGENSLRKLVAENPDAEFIVMLGNRALIKRVKFEEYLNKAKSVEDAFNPDISTEVEPEKELVVPEVKPRKKPSRSWIR